MKLTKRTTVSALATAMLAVVGSMGALPTATADEPAPGWRYTMVGFSSASVKDMDVYESGDGTDYAILRKSAYRPESGVVRDPSIFRHTDGQYYITYTTGESTIGFARSSDRVNWTPMANWPVPFCCAFLPGTGDGKGPQSPPFFSGSAGFKDGPSLSPFTTKAWAPEWFVDDDGSVNVIMSMSTGGGFVPYLLTALDPSLRLWSWPVPIAGLNADRIDTTIVKVGSTYHAFTKNETKKVIEHAVAPSLKGPYSFVTPGKWGTFVEGPTVVQLPNGTWRMYLDAYKENKYLYSDSTDGLTTWSPVKEVPGVSGSVRHFGVMREPAVPVAETAKPGVQSPN